MEKKALSDTDVGFYHVPDSGSRGTCTCKRGKAFHQRWYFSLHILFPMLVIMVLFLLVAVSFQCLSLLYLWSPFYHTPKTCI